MTDVRPRVDLTTGSNRFTQYPIRRSKASLTQEEKQLNLNLSCFLMTNLVFLDNTKTGNWLLLCMNIFFHCVLSILPRWLYNF